MSLSCLTHVLTLALQAPVERTGAEPQVLPMLQFSRDLVYWMVDLGLICIGLGIALCLWRLMRGPHLVDRALALDTVALNLVGLVLLLSMRYNTLHFIDSILILSLLGFAGTVAAAQYIARPHLRRAEQARQEAQPPSPTTPKDQGTP